MSDKKKCVLYHERKNVCRGLAKLYCEGRLKRGIPEPAPDCHFFKDKENFCVDENGFVHKKPASIFEKR